MMTEEKVLKKSGVEDTKDKLIELASKFDKMDPEVAKKAIEQFPDFAGTAKGIISDYVEIFKRAYDSNDQAIIKVYEVCESVINELKIMLERDDLSFEQKKYIIEKMEDILEQIQKAEANNKKYQYGCLVLGSLVVVAAIVTLSSAIGGSAKLGLA